MTRTIIALACGFAVLAPAGATLAQDKSESEPSASPGAPARLFGQVTSIDVPNNLVTLRSDDGSVHQFRGNPDTIKSLKIGDRIELTKRGTAP
jgi:hypothetical protein